jgi:hypothetical protein
VRDESIEFVVIRIYENSYTPLDGVHMPEIAAVKGVSLQESRQTLWHCRRCSALIAIYSAESVHLAICPICCDVTLDQRGSFESILGMTFPEHSTATS